MCVIDILIYYFRIESKNCGSCFLERGSGVELRRIEKLDYCFQLDSDLDICMHGHD